MGKQLTSLNVKEAEELLKGTELIGSHSISEYCGSEHFIGDADKYFAEESTLSSVISTFHARKYYSVVADDDILGNIRANHFIIEEGSSEDSYSLYSDALILVTGNHKGIRMTDIYLKPKGKIDGDMAHQHMIELYPELAD